jgi:hypothetical protein
MQRHIGRWLVPTTLLALAVLACGGEKQPGLLLQDLIEKVDASCSGSTEVVTSLRHEGLPYALSPSHCTSADTVRSNAGRYSSPR